MLLIDRECVAHLFSVWGQFSLLESLVRVEIGNQQAILFQSQFVELEILHDLKDWEWHVEVTFVMAYALKRTNWIYYSNDLHVILGGSPLHPH